MPEKAGTQGRRSLPEAMKKHCFKPGQSGNPSGANGIAWVQEQGRSWWKNGGLKRVMDYADNPQSAHHWKAIELLAKHFLPEEPKAISNPDGSNLAPAGFVLIGDIPE